MATKAKFWFKVTAVTGGGVTVRVHLAHAADTEWTDGATAVLDADAADFQSTSTHLQTATTAVTSTGWKSVELDASLLPIGTGTIYLRMSHTGEGNPSSASITFASQNNATAADRPYLELYEESSVRLLASCGAGT